MAIKTSTKTIQVILDQKMYNKLAKKIKAKNLAEGTPGKISPFIKNEFLIPFLNSGQTFRQVIQNKKT